MLPDSIPSSVWDEFRKHRKKLRAPMTDHCETLILCKLEKWRIENNANPIDIINHSIEMGWRGIFLNGHGAGSLAKSGVAHPTNANSCKVCGSTTWTNLNRYRECERCQTK